MRKEINGSCCTRQMERRCKECNRYMRLIASVATLVTNCHVAGQEGRKVNQNKLLSKSAKLRQVTEHRVACPVSNKLFRFNPYESKCKICKSKVHQPQANYCQRESEAVHYTSSFYANIKTVECAYKRGICAMCGKQVLDTTSYKQSSK